MKAWLTTILAIVLCTSCGFFSLDVVTSNYATLADARADNLFGRGWLPDILPESAHSIKTSNNLDVNTSVGEFSFSAKDGSGFFARLTPGAPDKSKFADWTEIVEGYSERGFSSWSYREEGFTWVFFCDRRKGKCDYILW